jgi:CHAD domain-containing protein
MRKRDLKIFPDQNIKKGIQRIAHLKIQCAVKATEIAGEECREDPHIIRTTFKFLRSIWKLSREIAGERNYLNENRKLRDAGRTLSPLRDRYIQVKTSQKIQSRIQDTIAKKQFGALTQYLQSQPGPSLEKCEELLKEAAVELNQFEQTFEKIVFPKKEWKAIQKALICSFQGSRKAMRAACKSETDEDLHEWRKKCKYFNYQIRLFIPLLDPHIQKACKRLGKLQDKLGTDHDAVILKEFIKTHKLPKNIQKAKLIPVLEEYRNPLQKKIRKLGEKVFRNKVKKLLNA